MRDRFLLALWRRESRSAFCSARGFVECNATCCYLLHPQSKYFGLGEINKDQVVLYAESKGMDLETAERWLSPILAY